MHILLIENIAYSNDFDIFLDSLCDPDKVSIIRKSLNKFAKGELDLDPKNCQHYDGRVNLD